MRMDAAESAELTNLCADLLCRGARALITIKLTGIQPIKQLKEAEKISLSALK